MRSARLVHNASGVAAPLHLHPSCPVLTSLKATSPATAAIMGPKRRKAATAPAEGAGASATEVVADASAAGQQQRDEGPREAPIHDDGAPADGGAGGKPSMAGPAGGAPSAAAGAVQAFPLPPGVDTAGLTEFEIDRLHM